PPNYDITVVDAVLRSGGTLLAGGLSSRNFTGTAVQAGIGNPSPSLLAVLRRTPNGGQVTIRVDLNEAVRDPRQNILLQGGDVLILQETPDEAITRYFTNITRLNLFLRFIDHKDAQGSVNLTAP